MSPQHRILVVDDEENIRRSLSGLLQDDGYEVKTACSGAECLAVLSVHAFDLVILDIVMPGMSGIAVLHAINENYADTEVIIISGFANKERAIAAFRFSAYDIIEKPYESREILKTIANCLERLKLRKEIERKNDELGKAYQMTRDILEKSPYGIFVADREGSINYVNPAMLGISGDTCEQFTGMNIYTLPTYRELGITEKIMTALDGEAFFIGPVEITSHFGKKTTMRNFIGIPLGEGERRKALIFVEDITERKKVEEEKTLLELQLRHAQKMEAIGTLTGGIAHEFNNILCTIMGYVELLQEGMPESDPLRNYVDIIQSSAERAAKLTEGLLAYSRKQVVHSEPLDINEIIRNVERLLSKLMDENIRLETMLGEGKLTVMVDRAQMEQVFMNLATNAEDAMPGGGTITIRTGYACIDGKSSEAPLYITPGTYALVSVSDTGTGMDRETRAKVFEPFFTTKEVGKGTGLGLSVVYGIIKKHNGYIDVWSEPGRGSTFKIYLAAAEAETGKAPATENAVPASGTETILLAEDDGAVRNLTKSVLERYGYKVIEAHDGEDALEKFMEHEEVVRLLLFDVVMPRKNGKEAYEEIKKRRPDIKVLFTSGHTADILQKKVCFEDDLNFIPKPGPPKELLRKVREVLDK